MEVLPPSAFLSPIHMTASSEAHNSFKRVEWDLRHDSVVLLYLLSVVEAQHLEQVVICYEDVTYFWYFTLAGIT